MMSMSRRSIPWLNVLARAVICVALLGGAMAALGALVSSRPQPARSPRSDAPPRLLTWWVRSESVSRQWTGYGTARPLDAAEIPAEVGAVVRSVPAEILVGATVDQGQELARLDERDFVSQRAGAAARRGDLQAQLDRLTIEEESWTKRLELAKRSSALAEAELGRATDALARDAAKQRDVDQARQALLSAQREETATEEEVRKVPARRAALQAQLAGAEADERLAELSIERCTIRSPLAGVLERVTLEAGQSVVPGQSVARVVSVDHVEVEIALAAGARQHVRIGDAVSLRSTGRSGQAWTSSVARVSPIDDPQTRTVAVIVEIHGSPPAPGQFLHATVRSSAIEKRSIVPRRAIVSDSVFVVGEGNALRAVAVESAWQMSGVRADSGLGDETWVVLDRTLPEGARIILAPGPRVAEGMVIEPVDGAR